jgi:hypothetical protein
MLIKILAASALTIGLATAAMAQSAVMDPSANLNRATPSNPPASQGMDQEMDQMSPGIDLGTTGSIYSDGMSSTTDPNCLATPRVPQPDATTTPNTPRTSSPTFNNNNCSR